jgi:diaminohydroxyphosphoribosylaminopyrimidine deaminase/5-amino-6-(5-phosphoribosylamino)uracil reductase
MCAASLDGKLAPGADRSSRPYAEYIPEKFTEELMELRDTVDGILAGGETVRLDDSEMLRPSGEPIRRIVVDSTGRLSEEHTLLSDAHSATIAVSQTTPEEYVERVNGLENKSTIEVGEDHVDLQRLLAELGEQDVDWLLLEGGGTLVNWMLRAELIDECRILTIPFFVGDRDAVSVCHGTTSLFPDVRLDVTDVTEREGFVLTEGTVRY